MNKYIVSFLSLGLVTALLAGSFILPRFVTPQTPAEIANPNTLTDEQRTGIESALRDSTSLIWFEKNVGQFANGALYGFRTVFGSMLVFDDHLQMLVNQTDPGIGQTGVHVVNISFTGSNKAWQIVPGELSGVQGTYQNPDGTVYHPNIFKELTLRDVYNGIDLRLYSVAKGTLEFDWLVAQAQDYQKIRTVYSGQDGISYTPDGSVTLDLRYQNLKLNMPETYQVINGVKQNVTARMVVGDHPNEMRYELSGVFSADQPLVIDPDIVWSTYFDLNDTVFDSYVYTIAVNGNGVYLSGWTREQITNGSFGNYMEVNAGFSQGTGTMQNYIYRLNNTGLNITAWTSTGRVNNGRRVTDQKINSATSDAVADLELFPDGRVLAGFASGFIQIYSADLSTRSYNGTPVTMDTLNSVAIASNGSFYASGRVTAAIPPAEIPAANIGPDATFAGNAGGLNTEGVIIRYSNATTTPTPDWATYVGGSNDEYFTAVALSPDKTKLGFATSTVVAGAYPALVNAVDNTIAGATELLVGVLADGNTRPAAFSVFSYLGGGAEEGTLVTNTTAAVVTATDTHFYVAGNTNSAAAGMPGITGGAQAANGGGIFDTFISRVPFNGSAGSGFQTTFLGGTTEDNIGGIVFDTAANQLLVFGTTNGAFPVVDSTPPGNFYQGTAGGARDIFIAIIDDTLATKLYATYIGGIYNDYLGETGDLIGQGHVFYSPFTGLSYLATTVHSTLPAAAIGNPPGKDTVKSNPDTSLNDVHTIYAFSSFNTNSYDYGDAPLTYDNGDAANAARSSTSEAIRIGATVDAESAPASGISATGDNTSNTGSSNDEDGIATMSNIILPATTYSVTVSVDNNTGAAHTLQGWIDFNRNGTFEAGEYASVNVPSNAAQQNVTLTWASLPGITDGQSYLRLRFNNAALADDPGTANIDERSIGVGGSGEVEDYALNITPNITITRTPPPQTNCIGLCIPVTGFEPNVVTDLSNTPRETYASTGGITVEVPSLGITLPIVGVPRNDGSWNVSWLGNQAGWLEGSAFPSWNGNSVLTGHVYLSNGLPGPFVNLYTLKFGEKVIVHAYGQKYIFEVRTNTIVEPSDTSFFQHEERPWLTLVTCKDYDERADAYRKRVLVRAVLVSVDWE